MRKASEEDPLNLLSGTCSEKLKKSDFGLSLSTSKMDPENNAEKCQVTTRFKAFLEEYYITELKEMMASDSINEYFDLNIDLCLLCHFDPNLFHKLITEAQVYFDLFVQAIHAHQLANISATYTLKHHICPRFIFPCHLEQYAVPKSSDTGTLIQMNGTVVRTGVLKMVENEKLVSCSRCKALHTLKFNISDHGFVNPVRCNAENSKKQKCLSYQFKEAPSDPANVVYRDYQEIQVQEHGDFLKMGKIPLSITAILMDKLVDKCKAGDNVKLTGIVKSRWAPLFKGNRPRIETVLDVNRIQVLNNEDLGVLITDQQRLYISTLQNKYLNKPLACRDFVLKSFCPTIYGMYCIKLAVVLIILGGTSKAVNTSSIQVRSESHLLLIGDPGTGKSQFLKFTSKLMPRAVLTAGVGSTTAGLTCSAVKEGNEFHLEAGALVLADGGICCIDEFGSIRENDKTAIHEAMEQQTLSVAKAGMICKLNTRCSVLAATNPKGTYDNSQSVEVNVGLGSPLLSRFDLIFVLVVKDSRNQTWDKIVSSHILMSEVNGADKKLSKEGIMSLEMLRAYIMHCKSFNPCMTKESESVLTAYYQLQRRKDQQNTTRTTIRLLESLIRLSQAHAKLMQRNKVILDDALTIVALFESSVLGLGFAGHHSSLHAGFPDDPDRELERIKPVILQRLGLESL